jgi:putative hydrolase of the HAD superfamily
MSQPPNLQPPKGILFDYGKVLSLPQNPASVRRMERLAGLSPDEFRRGYWGLREEYDRGVLRGRDFWGRLIDSRGEPLGEERLRQLIDADLRSWMDLNEPVLRWALGLPGRGLRIAVLSNMPPELAEGMRREFRWLSRFDARVFSGELGLVKPEPGIFSYSLEALGLGPSEVLFIDDDEENVAGAERAGIPAFLYRPGRTGVEELERRLDRPSSG